MATAVAAAKTAQAAANGGDSSFSPLPGGGFTRLRWLPPGPAARDGRAAILEERRPRLPATCAPIGGRRGSWRLVTVAIAPAREEAEADGRRSTRRLLQGFRRWAHGPTGDRGELRDAPALRPPGSRRARLRRPLFLRCTPGSADPGVEQDRRRPRLALMALWTSSVSGTRRQMSSRKTSLSHFPGSAATKEQKGDVRLSPRPGLKCDLTLLPAQPLSPSKL
ncbi:uncharacterized protein LOC125110595 [Phacochoerus africanus]|uniref:uncharacterized protein LOC125110595 n=1 Tax=Phacochoerus africanus TaxID=41426 RepID=UPI001FDA9A69|nr:uncharacterized protein LOC125110595 [Phacochoerus africanus]